MTTHKEQLMKPMYGIAESKQGRLKKLNIEVLAAEFKVNELQAVVDALNAKSSTFQGFLATAEADKDTALANLNLLKEVVNSVDELVTNSKTIRQRSHHANKENEKVAHKMSTVIEKLIFSADMIERLSTAINKKKAINPLIPDALVARMTTAVSAANKAVAATLTALQSCTTATASSYESLSTLMLENTQAKQLQQHLTGIGGTDSGSAQIKNCWHELQKQDEAYKNALTAFLSATNDHETAIAKFKSAQKDEKASEDKILQLADKLLEEEEAELDDYHADCAAYLIKLDKKKKKAEADLDKAKEDADEGRILAAEAKLLELAQEILDIMQEKEKAQEELEKVRKKNQLINDELEKLKTKLQEVRSALTPSEDAMNKTKDALDIEKSAFKVVKKKFDAATKKLDRTMEYYKRTDDGQNENSLDFLLTRAYGESVKRYNEKRKENERVTRELEAASKKLIIAQNELSSLTAGYSAATAAALAA